VGCTEERADDAALQSDVAIRLRSGLQGRPTSEPLVRTRLAPDRLAGSGSRVRLFSCVCRPWSCRMNARSCRSPGPRVAIRSAGP